MGGRSYFRSLVASEVKRVFPFLRRIKGYTSRTAMMMICAVLISPLILYRAWVQFTIPYVEVVITPKCNLRCAGCANLMPCYAKTVPHVDVKTVKASIDALLTASKRVTELKLIGGEPFLHPQLSEIVQYAANNPKIKNIIITTNGSVIPKGENLTSMVRDKVIVNISDYPMVDSGKLTNALDQHKIKYEMVEFENWSDYGDTNKRSLPDHILERSFRECASAECKTILNGQLFICPRAAHGRELSIIPDSENDFVELLHEEPKQLREKIKRLYSLPYTTACDYCTPVWERQEIECGKQLED